MSSAPVAGTFRLDGMLQGPTPGDERVADQMRDWVDRAAADGLTFHLAFEGGNYSMVADPTVQRWSRDDLSPGESLRKVLDQFLELLAPDERSRAFSTIRCEEFLPGRALQSVFQISRDGKIEKAEREIDIETRSPGPDLSRARLRRIALPLLAVLLVGGLLSIFVVDYRGLFADARERVMPLKKEEVAVDQERLGEVFHIEISEIDRERSALILQVSKGPDWKPLSTSSPAQAQDNWQSFSLAQALHRKRLQYDLFGTEDQYLGTGQVRLDGLDEKEDIRVAIAARVSRRLARVVFYP